GPVRGELVEIPLQGQLGQHDEVGAAGGRRLDELEVPGAVGALVVHGVHVGGGDAHARGAPLPHLDDVLYLIAHAPPPIRSEPSRRPSAPSHPSRPFARTGSGLILDIRATSARLTRTKGL